MKRLSLLALAMLLAGCGAHGPFRDRGNDYLHARTVPPLVWPEGVPLIESRELYPIADVENRARAEAGRKKKIVIPEPPALELPAAPAEAKTANAAATPLPAAKVSLTRDGNDYPVLMLDLGFDWAWQTLGDVLKRLDDITVDDLDRERAVYFVLIDDEGNSAGDPWELKLNHTANGIQVALQIDEEGMAPKDVAGPLMQQIHDGLLK